MTAPYRQASPMMLHPIAKRRQSHSRHKIIKFVRALPLSHCRPACFAYLCLLNFRDSYCARSGLLNHFSSDGFDCWSDRLFDFPSGFLHWRAFGLRLCNRLRLRSLACFTAFGWGSSLPFCSLLYFRSLLVFCLCRPPFWLGLRKSLMCGCPVRVH